MGAGLRAFVDGYLDVPSTNAAGGLSPSGAGRGRGIERVGQRVEGPREAPFGEYLFGYGLTKPTISSPAASR